MIYKHSNETQTKRDHGEFKVQLNLPNNRRPMGFCDGGEADLNERRAIAESKCAGQVRIEVKRLETGRLTSTLYSDE